MSEKIVYDVSSTINLKSFLEILVASSWGANDISLENDGTNCGKKINSTVANRGITDTSNFRSTRSALEIEKRTLSFIAEYSKEKRILEVEKLTKKLSTKLQLFSYDDESMELIWPMFDEIMELTPLDILGEALQKVYLSNNDCPNVLCAICRLLTSLELEEASPWGTMILIGMLNHKDETVKEYAVILLDNWKDKTLIPVLQNLDCRAIWLQSYINDVLLSLEK